MGCSYSGNCVPTASWERFLCWPQREAWQGLQIHSTRSLLVSYKPSPSPPASQPLFLPDESGAAGCQARELAPALLCPSSAQVPVASTCNGSPSPPQAAGLIHAIAGVPVLREMSDSEEPCHLVLLCYTPRSWFHLIRETER